MGTYSCCRTTSRRPVPPRTTGDSHLTLRQDGSYTFSGHFHDSGLAPYDTALAWVVKDIADRAYTFQHGGHISGSFEPGSSDDNWNVSGTNIAIADNWANIDASAPRRPEASVSIDLGDVLGLAMEAAGVVAQIVAIVV
jgi:hypothetical protein